MLRGLYTAASSMMAQMTRQGIINNNIANATTTGFKQELASQGLFQRLLLNRIQRLDQPIGETTTGADPLGPFGNTAGAVRATTDLAQGSLRDTGGELDLALSGPGFFVVQTPAGPHLTRDGSFGRDADGRLVADDGGLVLGADGPLTLPSGEVAVAADGTIAVDGQAVGRLQIVDLPADQLTRAGLNRFAPRAVTDMMAAARAYEAGQRLVQIQDDLLGKAVNDVGRVG